MRMRSATVFARSKISSLSSISCSLFPVPWSLFPVCGCRYYDPQTGTFTSRDTYLDQKPYLYCEHDPVNAVDPSGHQGGPGPVPSSAMPPGYQRSYEPSNEAKYWQKTYEIEACTVGAGAIGIVYLPTGALVGRIILGLITLGTVDGANGLSEAGDPSEAVAATALRPAISLHVAQNAELLIAASPAHKDDKDKWE